MAVLPTGFGENKFYESFVILKDKSDPNQTPSIVHNSLSDHHRRLIRSNDYLWVVAFKEKGNVWKVTESSFLQNKLCILASLIY